MTGPNARQALRRSFDTAEDALRVTGISGGGIISPSISTKITNLSLPTADTEVTHALTANTRQLFIRSRTLAELKIAFTATESGTNFVTILEGATFFIKDIDFTGELVALQSSTASLTIEIIETF